MMNESNYPERERILGNHFTAKGNIRCRFDLFIRWPDNAGRKINPFTHRGDRFGITEADKMLCSLLRYFIKDYSSWMLAELYDNTFPLNDPNRVVLEWKKGKILTNRLKNYDLMLQSFPLPEWLKQ